MPRPHRPTPAMVNHVDQNHADQHRIDQNHVDHCSVDVAFIVSALSKQVNPQENAHHLPVKSPPGVLYLVEGTVIGGVANGVRIQGHSVEHVWRCSIQHGGNLCTVHCHLCACMCDVGICMYV